MGSGLLLVVTLIQSNPDTVKESAVTHCLLILMSVLPFVMFSEIMNIRK